MKKLIIAFVFLCLLILSSINYDLHKKVSIQNERMKVLHLNLNRVIDSVRELKEMSELSITPP